MPKQLYYGGDIITVDDCIPHATAVLVNSGIIEAVFTDDSYQSIADAERVNLAGKTLVPGFIDGHSHIVDNAFAAFTLNASPTPLGQSNSVEELIENLKLSLKDKRFEGQPYIFARGYDEAVYPDHRLPTKYDLDQVTEKPLALIHASGHNIVFNSAALALAGVDDSYTPPPGGSADRFPDGTLTGVFHENACGDVAPKTKKDEAKIIQDGFSHAVYTYKSVGVTTAQNAMTSKKQYDFLAGLSGQIDFEIDILSYINAEDAAEALAPGVTATAYKNHLRAAGVKLFLDGSPQAKTAWLSVPYFLPPKGQASDYRGYGIYDDKAVLEIFKAVIKNKWQINVHTNGDEAIEQLIRVYEKALAETGGDRSLRPVSIHCQTVREDQLDRMKALGIIASFFVDHTFYWGDYHRDFVLGEARANRISPLSSALSRGINFSIHQDTPVAKQDPIFALHCAVNRITRSGKTLGEQYRISVLEALKALTINTAYQIFEEDRKGSITPGKLADFAVLSGNPLTVSPENIQNITVLQTIKNGKIIFNAIS